jgi:transcriptional regulator GlxA family with amidase domain
MFRAMFPEIQMQDEKIVIDEDGIYTCGGATSFLNLCLYLIDKFCGKETAVMTSKMLLLDLDKTRQSNYSIFVPQMAHQDEAIISAQKLIETNAGQKLSVESRRHVLASRVL